ncbi:LOW QUALITY PROTEIN: hypothetical protein KUTeg_002108 [Tegillarca granosa]|uniref:Uncharacterized protein n=1 Tax=Tegillarca granosa TaxID=220873 RepID=A0ABQ9FUU7_TEGGR|nr:LOW QUALITY PROTEIN: hypothetical protein KUTeg_002108 [Tegillarca granosa]
MYDDISQIFEMCSIVKRVTLAYFNAYMYLEFQKYKDIYLLKFCYIYLYYIFPLSVKLNDNTSI